MHLPPELEDQLYEEIKHEEEKNEMKFMTYPERKGYERGVKQGVEQGIERGVKQGIERGVKQGIERGVKQGIEKGVKKGGHDAQVSLLSHVLKHRFGDLPAEVLDTLQAGTSKQILAWTDAALDADSLQDVFG